MNQIKPTPCKRRILAKKPHHLQALSHPGILQQVIRDYVSSLYLLKLMHSPISLSCFHLMVTNSSSSTQPLCDNNQSSVLLEFKQSFLIGQHASDDPSAYLNAAAWKSEGDGRYCCSWDVGECDKDTGHVISLNLGSSRLLVLSTSVAPSSALGIFKGLISLIMISITLYHFWSCPAFESKKSTPPLFQMLRPNPIEALT